MNRASGRRPTFIRPTIKRSALAAVLIAAALALSACLSPTASLLLTLVPDGTFPMLLSHMERVSDTNRRQLAELEQKGDWNGVVRVARENIARDPTSVDWWIVQGYAQSQLRAFQAAAESFQQAVRLSPDDMDAWNLLAQAHRALGQPAQAVRILDRALLVNQDSPLTWYFLAESFSDLKRYDRAVPNYQQALTRNPQLGPAWYGLAVAQWRLGRKAELEDALSGLRRVNPKLAGELEQAMATPR